MSIKILTKNAVENTNIDGARDCNFNAGRRSGIVKGALNQGNFFSSSSNTIALDTCELRLCGHRIVLDAVEYKTLSNIPSVPIRYSMVAQVVVDDNNDVSFDLIIQSSSTPLVQENLDTTGKGKFQLEIGKFTQQTDGTITDIVRTADLITGGIGDSDGGKINIGNVTTNTLEPGMEAEVDVENRYDAEKKKTFTDFTFSIPKGNQGIQGIQGQKGETGATGNGIISISKTGTSKLVDTYTISFTSGATTTFQVTNGKGITKIEKTATSGLVDTYTITFNDTTTNTFQVTNGAKGDKGDKGDVGVTPNITAEAETLSAGSQATVTKSGTAENPKFKFGIPKGEKGDKGDQGASAGFGTPTATTDSNVGIPSVTITASGSDTSKVFNFAFKNIKGEKGDKGDTGATPNISVSATTLSAGSAATATISGSAESPTITFGIPKGDKGESGEIYQSTGTSTTGAMSQKATTDELSKITNNISKISDANGGFAGGNGASTLAGGAVGYNAHVTTGGAIGAYATASLGFAGGYNAKTIYHDESTLLDAIQLGSGTNSQEKTLQVYDDNLYNAETHQLSSALLNAIYPVGAIYVSVVSTSPASLFGGTWEELPANNALWTTAISSANAGTTISAGLPNIQGQLDMRATYNAETFYNASGALKNLDGGSGTKWANGFSLHSTSKNLDRITFNASSSNSIYGKSSTVQPPAYRIYAWKRKA